MKIYKYLKETGKHTVSEIVEIAKLKQPTVSYHLNTMKEAGLLDSEKQGKKVYYFTNHECVLDKVSFLKEKK